MATTAKEEVRDPMLLTVKLYTERLEASHPVSFCACADKPMKQTRKRHVMKGQELTETLEGPVVVSTQATRPRQGVVHKNYCEDLDYDYVS